MYISCSKKNGFVSLAVCMGAALPSRLKCLTPQGLHGGYSIPAVLRKHTCMNLFLLWQVAYCHRISSEGCIEELFRNSPLLEVVDLRYVETVCDRTLLFLTEYCTNLKQLYIKGCPLVTMESLVRLHDEKGVQIDVPFTRLRAKKCMVKFLMPVWCIHVKCPNYCIIILALFWKQYFSLILHTRK